MNRAYRIVWSAARQAWIVTSEKAGSGGRPPLAVKNVAGALILLGLAGTAAAETYSGSEVTYYTPLMLNVGDTATSASVSSGERSMSTAAAWRAVATSAASYFTVIIRR